MIQPKFYSQNGEDYLLWSFFDGKTDGFYVDIGAFDGIHFSNTYAFERLGWDGICVEPNPEIFACCLRNRPKAICLNKACTGDPQQKTVRLFVDEMGLLSTSIIDANRIKDIEYRYRKRGLEFKGLNEIEVAACTIDEMLAQYGPKNGEIDFLSLDVEGGEIGLLESIDFHQHGIRIIVVEFDKTDEGKMLQVLLKKGNYRFVRQTTNNSIFVKEAADFEKMKSISLNCRIEGQMHPKGILYTPPRIRKERTIKDGKIIWE
jgi:FkbM family methyltransferase